MAPVWWHVVVALAVARRAHAQAATPTVCQDESCRCDSFTRVICDCTNDYDEVTLRPDGAFRIPVGATGIIINGCARVYFLEDTAKQLVHLRSIELRNVKHVYIKERALSWSPYTREYELTSPGLSIYIENSTIHDIASHAIKGRIDDVTISNSRINTIKPFAFSSLTGVKFIKLVNNIYDNIEIQAFKKFTTQNFEMRGGSVRTLPSRFLSDVEIGNMFHMDGVSVRHVASLAFLVTSPRRVLVENNYIEELEGDAYHMTTRGPITFRNNTILVAKKGAFMGFSVDREVTSVLGAQELLLDNNTITYIEPSVLNLTQPSVSLRLDGLNLNVTCSCDLAEVWRDVLSAHGGAVTCWYALEGHTVSLPTYVDTRCGAFKQNFWIFIVVGIVLAVLVVVVITICVVRKENEKKKKVAIVMPDGKTYRETEFHIVVERAELLTTDL